MYDYEKINSSDTPPTPQPEGSNFQPAQPVAPAYPVQEAAQAPAEQAAAQPARWPYAAQQAEAPAPARPSGSYAYGQGSIAPEPVGEAPPPPTAGYEFVQPEPAPQPPKKAKRGRRFLSAVAIVLASAVAGFGGGYAAVVLTSYNKPPVVYRAPQGNTGSPVSKNENSLAITDVAAIAAKSFVSISVQQTVNDPMMGKQVAEGAGSGVVISEDGYIITNDHVVEGAETVKVTLPDGSIHDAKVIGTDSTTDIAVIKIEVGGLTPVVVGDSDTLILGEPILAIGNPTGTLGGTVTNGIMSALNREIVIGNTSMNLLQFSAAVSPGNSGGGLFNMQGNLVGVVNAKSGADNTEGIGFAIPVNTAMRVAEELIDKGFVSRPAMGVTVVQIVEGDPVASELGYETPGVYIQDIMDGGAAQKAGLQTGDRILSAEGMPVQINSDLTGIINQKKVGDTLTLEVDRAGETLEVTLTLQQKQDS